MLPWTTAHARQDEARAWAYPAFCQWSPVDHTYVQGLASSGPGFLCKCLGGDQGGKVLPGSVVSGTGLPFKRMHFMCSTKPCAWPKLLYGTVGVCHQLANRGLEPVGATVYQARGYGLSFVLYGAYGRLNAVTLPFAMYLCRKKAPKGGQKKSLSPQVRLFRGFADSLLKIAPQLSAGQIIGRHRAYSRDALNLRMEQTIPGAGVSKFQFVMNLWHRVQQSLDQIWAEFGNGIIANQEISKPYVNRLDALVRSVQTDLAEVLSPEEYFNFLRLPYPKSKRDLASWRDFVDPNGPVRLP